MSRPRRKPYRSGSGRCGRCCAWPEPNRDPLPCPRPLHHTSAGATGGSRIGLATAGARLPPALQPNHPELAQTDQTSLADLAVRRRRPALLDREVVNGHQHGFPQASQGTTKEVLCVGSVRIAGEADGSGSGHSHDVLEIPRSLESRCRTSPSRLKLGAFKRCATS